MSGGGGIRTRGILRYGGLVNLCTRPLCDPSKVSQRRLYLLKANAEAAYRRYADPSVKTRPYRSNGGGGGIRTRECLRTHAFQACRMDHYLTPPKWVKEDYIFLRRTRRKDMLISDSSKSSITQAIFYLKLHKCTWWDSNSQSFPSEGKT